MEGTSIQARRRDGPAFAMSGIGASPGPAAVSGASARISPRIKG
jgi:hypothetical protein